MRVHRVARHVAVFPGVGMAALPGPPGEKNDLLQKRLQPTMLFNDKLLMREETMAQENK